MPFTVYKLTCVCKDIYIGSTKKTILDRLKLHFQHASNNAEEHWQCHCNNNHDLVKYEALHENVGTLDEILYLEAKEIWENRNPSLINVNKPGRFTVYLLSCDCGIEKILMRAPTGYFRGPPLRNVVS